MRISFFSAAADALLIFADAFHAASKSGRSLAGSAGGKKSLESSL